jgi:hypothetical protein
MTALGSIAGLERSLKPSKLIVRSLATSPTAAD